MAVSCLLNFRLVVLSLFTLPVLSATRSYELTIANKDIAPDGFKRSTVLANGEFPGPLISANNGDTLSVNVLNKLTDSSMDVATTIHWHGIFQHRTAYADGTADVTQCPIAPNDSFLYQFPLNQTGTYWYHSHFGTQYCDGLRGPLVIYDPHDPLAHLYDVDNANTVLTLADWEHLPGPQSFTAIENPEATLFNGLGRAINGSATPLAVVNVKKGLRYRMRLVNIACFSYYTFQIDSHQLIVIEADGVETQPLSVNSLDIYAGQRYSFVLMANQNVGNYWIRANPGQGVPPGFDGGRNSAILRYAGAPAVEPTSHLVNGSHMEETQLQPLTNPGSPGGNREPDIHINLNITLDTTSASFPFFRVNGQHYVPPPVPVLLQILSGAVSPEQLQPKGTVFYLPKNKLVEVSIPGGSPASPHPFHLHGHTFDVVRSAGSTRYNYNNPVRRDVVNTGDTGDNATFRFMTDNPGPWFLHCHINWHLQASLAVVFAEDPADVHSGPEAEKPPKAWDELCPKFNALPDSQKQQL